MKRDVECLGNTPFDVLVVGGGIHGAILAWESARAGLRTALLEKGDFAGATSANSLKILHGGLRYLQHLDFPRMRQSIRSRRAIAGFAPHLVRPLPCMIATHGMGIKSRLAMGVALWMNDCVSADRNKGLPPAVHLPRGRLIRKKDYLERLKGAADPHSSGAALWYDYLCLDTERLVLAYLSEAAAAGACICNYAEVESIDSGDAPGERRVTVRDELSGASFGVRAKVVVLAMGPWPAKRLLGETVLPDDVPLAKGVNLVVDRPWIGAEAAGVEGVIDSGNGQPAKRFFFLVPWKGRTMIGTTYTVSSIEAHPPVVSATELDSIVDGVNRLVPGFGLKTDEISHVHAGLLPITTTQGDPSKKLQRHSHVAMPRPGVLRIDSVKFTTAPEIARIVLRAIGKVLEIKISPKPLELPQASMHAAPDGVSEVVWMRLSERYGSLAARVLEWASSHPEWLQPVSPEESVLRVEVMYALREEMAVSLCDLLFRRLDVGSTHTPSEAWFSALGDLLTSEGGWDKDRLAKEIASVKACFARMGF